MRKRCHTVCNLILDAVQIIENTYSGVRQHYELLLMEHDKIQTLLIQYVLSADWKEVVVPPPKKKS